MDKMRLLAVAENTGSKDGLRASVSAWTLFGGLYGGADVVEAVGRLASRAFKSLGARTVVFDRQRVMRLQRLLSWTPTPMFRRMKTFIQRLGPTIDILEGIPSALPLALAYAHGAVQSAEANPSADGVGLYWYAPLVPMLPNVVREYVTNVRRVCESHQIVPRITLSTQSDRCFDSTVPVLFDPTNTTESAHAAACFRELVHVNARHGLVPYRVPAQFMNLLPATEHAALVSRIRHAVDPGGILAPGRYDPNYWVGLAASAAGTAG